MYSVRDEFNGLVLLLGCLLLGCSRPPAATARELSDANDTGRTLAVSNESERALLQRLSALPSGKPQHIGDATVIAEAPYSAASGRSCRSLHVTRAQTSRNRLACNDGRGWYFVPDIFGTEVAE